MNAVGGGGRPINLPDKQTQSGLKKIMIFKKNKKSDFFI